MLHFTYFTYLPHYKGIFLRFHNQENQIRILIKLTQNDEKNTYVTILLHMSIFFFNSLDHMYMTSFFTILDHIRKLFDHILQIFFFFSSFEVIYDKFWSTQDNEWQFFDHFLSYPITFWSYITIFLIICDIQWFILSIKVTNEFIWWMMRSSMCRSHIRSFLIVKFWSIWKKNKLDYMIIQKCSFRDFLSWIFHSILSNRWKINYMT